MASSKESSKDICYGRFSDEQGGSYGFEDKIVQYLHNSFCKGNRHKGFSYYTQQNF